MSRQFTANQYEGAFCRISHWEVPNQQSQDPKPQDGFTVFIANNKGHLLEGVKRSKDPPWGNFVDTWDLPLKIPGNCGLNSTARKLSSAKHLSSIKENFDKEIEEKAILSATALRIMRKTKNIDVPNQEPATAKSSPRNVTSQRSQREEINEEKIKENVTDKKPTD